MPARAPLGLSRGARTARAAAGLRLAAIACAALAVAAGPLSVVAVRRGLMNADAAEGGVAHGAVPALALAAIALGLVAFVMALLTTPRRGLVGALGAVAAGALVYAALAAGHARDAAHPPVHDVSTDWRDPPMPSARLLAQRGPGANPIEAAPAVPEGPGGGGFLGRPVAEVNARTCPAATPATVTLPPPEAYVRLKAAVLRDRMTLVTDDPASGVLEATARRGPYAVADDLMARVRPEGAGARIDLRSVARTGLNDGGADCDRVTRLRAALAK